MTIERTIDLEKSSTFVVMQLTYHAEYVDHSFAHEFGTEIQGGYEVTHWELAISKFTVGWKAITIDCLEVPEPIYDLLNTIVEKHLEENPPDA